MIRRLTLGVLIVVLASATRTTRLRAFNEHQRKAHYEDVYYLPPPNWLPLMSLGYTSAFADLLWCRTLVYYGDELAARGAVRHIFDYTDAILNLDPDFQAPYTFVATASSFRPVANDLQTAMRGLNYLRRAVQRWPNDGQLRWATGSYLLFELSPLVKDPEQRQKLKLEAGPHLHIAALKGAGPPWLALNSAKLLSSLGKRDAAIRQLEEVYATVNDDETREQIALRLTQLRAETEALALRATVADFERERTTWFPYLSPDLYWLVGPKVSQAYQRSIAARFLPPELDEGEPEAVEQLEN